MTQAEIACGIPTKYLTKIFPTISHSRVSVLLGTSVLFHSIFHISLSTTPWSLSKSEKLQNGTSREHDLKFAYRFQTVVYIYVLNNLAEVREKFRIRMHNRVGICPGEHGLLNKRKTCPFAVVSNTDWKLLNIKILGGIILSHWIILNSQIQNKIIKSH